eukprot:5369904-Amphidinium_carterae.1
MSSEQRAHCRQALPGRQSRAVTESVNVWCVCELIVDPLRHLISWLALPYTYTCVHRDQFLLKFRPSSFCCFHNH